MRVLMIDNFDSFTQNLRQLFEEVPGTSVDIISNTAPVTARAAEGYDALVISAGPGRPDRAADLGSSLEAVNVTGLPTFGVCLGHQAIGHVFGAEVKPTGAPMHGRLSTIRHVGRDIFAGLETTFPVVRYHSLDVQRLPAELEPLAWAEDDGALMALRHRSLPLWGVQFHPESILSAHGVDLVSSFLSHAAQVGPVSTPAIRTALAPTARRLVRTLDWAVDLEAAYPLLVPENSPGVWLESSDRSTESGRISAIAMGAPGRAEVITYEVEASRLTQSCGGNVTEHSVPDLLDYLQARLTRFALPPAPELPVEIDCGWFGYLGYELKAQTVPASVGHRSEHPDGAFLFAERLLVVDHHEQRAFLVALVRPGDDECVERWADETASLLAGLPAPDAPEEAAAPLSWTSYDEVAGARPRHDADSYLAKIQACQQAIHDGETYEVCLTNIVELPHAADPRSVFAELRRISPVPFGGLLELGGLTVISASPERFLRVDSAGYAESKPIKGTRARSADPVADAVLRDELASCEKDQAENLMIVDLVRHDLNAVCVPGTVHVPKLFDVETYPSVHQLVSTVRGRLLPTVSAIDAVRSAFPGGSMTGAPKRRTMEIIDELEEGPRGVYSGSIGWLGINGAIDLNIAIRTIVVDPTKTTIGIGGAIIALSDPHEELVETQVKSRSTVTALLSAAREMAP